MSKSIMSYRAIDGFDESCTENELLEIADAYARPLSPYLKEETK